MRCPNRCIIECLCRSYVYRITGSQCPYCRNSRRNSRPIIDFSIGCSCYSYSHLIDSSCSSCIADVIIACYIRTTILYGKLRSSQHMRCPNSCIVECLCRSYVYRITGNQCSYRRNSRRNSRAIIGFNIGCCCYSYSHLFVSSCSSCIADVIIACYIRTTILYGKLRSRQHMRCPNSCIVECLCRSYVYRITGNQCSYRRNSRRNSRAIIGFSIGCSCYSYSHLIDSSCSSCIADVIIACYIRTTILYGKLRSSQHMRCPNSCIVECLCRSYVYRITGNQCSYRRNSRRNSRAIIGFNIGCCCYSYSHLIDGSCSSCIADVIIACYIRTTFLHGKLRSSKHMRCSNRCIIECLCRSYIYRITGSQCSYCRNSCRNSRPIIDFSIGCSCYSYSHLIDSSCSSCIADVIIACYIRTTILYGKLRSSQHMRCPNSCIVECLCRSYVYRITGNQCSYRRNSRRNSRAIIGFSIGCCCYSYSHLIDSSCSSCIADVIIACYIRTTILYGKLRSRQHMRCPNSCIVECLCRSYVYRITGNQCSYRRNSRRNSRAIIGFSIGCSCYSYSHLMDSSCSSCIADVIIACYIRTTILYGKLRSSQHMRCPNSCIVECLCRSYVYRITGTQCSYCRNSRRNSRAVIGFG